LRVAGVDDVPLAERGRPAEILFSTARYEIRAVAGALVPFGWSPDYAPEAPAAAWWLALLGALIVAIAFLARRRITRLPAMGLALALLAPLPTSPLVGPANERADRFIFLGVLGGALVWAWLWDLATQRWVPGPRSRALLLGAALTPCVFVCQRAAAPWENDFALWTSAVERSPDSFRAWVGLSRAFRIRGRLDQADAAVARALAIEPRSLSAHVTRAYNRLARGNVEGARQDIARVRELGGPRQKGLRRAERCAALEPPAAQACIGAPSQPGPTGR
jgi:tetratricopeptide (TPR) repeat protein